MRKQTLITIVFAILCLDYLFGLPRPEDDRAKAILAIVETQGSFLLHGAVLHKPFGHPVRKIEVDVGYSKFEESHLLLTFHQARIECTTTTSARPRITPIASSH